VPPEQRLPPTAASREIQQRPAAEINEREAAGMLDAYLERAVG
jgi:hypothetical protein